MRRLRTQQTHHYQPAGRLSFRCDYTQPLPWRLWRPTNLQRSRCRDFRHWHWCRLRWADRECGHRGRCWGGRLDMPHVDDRLEDRLVHSHSSGVSSVMTPCMFLTWAFPPQAPIFSPRQPSNQQANIWVLLHEVRELLLDARHVDVASPLPLFGPRRLHPFLLGPLRLHPFWPVALLAALLDVASTSPCEDEVVIATTFV